MFYGFGHRQRELLEKLLIKKNGLTIDDLAKEFEEACRNYKTI